MITKEEYMLTNIDLKTGKFKIRLNDNKEYIVYYKKENGKTINYIIKDNKEIPLDDEVSRWHIEQVREYQVSGI